MRTTLRGIHQYENIKNKQGQLRDHLNICLKKGARKKEIQKHLNMFLHQI